MTFRGSSCLVMQCSSALQVQIQPAFFILNSSSDSNNSSNVNYHGGRGEETLPSLQPQQRDMFTICGIQKTVFTCDLHAEVILRFWFNVLHLFDLLIIKILQTQTHFRRLCWSCMVSVSKTDALTHVTEIPLQFLNSFSQMLPVWKMRITQ